MKTRFILSSMAATMVASVVASTAAISATEANNVRIIGGDEAQLQQYPFISGVVGKGDAASNVFCGASVIAPQWILTAAHCLEENPVASAYDVIVNTANLDNATAQNRVAVTEVIMHPAYDGGNVVNDMALLKLARNVDATPVRVATQADSALFSEGQPVSVAGWGNLSTSGESFPSQLHAVDLSISNFQACNAAYQGLSEAHICATVPGGGKDSCQGDSGGPLVARSDKGPVQVGVVSFGDDCGSATHPGVYARVSSYGDFLAQALGNTSPTTSPIAGNPPSQPSDPEVVAESPADTTADMTDANDQQDVEAGSEPTVNDGLEFVWLDEFESTAVGTETFASAEVFNNTNTPIVLENTELNSSANVAIDFDECSGVELYPGDFCYIDLYWQPEQSGDLDGELIIQAFDGADSRTYQLYLEGLAMGQVDFGEVLDLPDAEYYTNDEDEWSWSHEDHLIGDHSLEGDVEAGQTLILDAEMDSEHDSVLEFSYQLDGVNCYVYINDEAEYELSASDSWQQVSFNVPVGADVRWEFRATSRSNIPKKVKLDGLSLTPASSSTSSKDTGMSISSAAEQANGLINTNTRSGGAGSTGGALLLAIFGTLALRRKQLPRRQLQGRSQ